MKHINKKIVFFSMATLSVFTGCNTEEEFSEDKVTIINQNQNTQFDKYLRKTFVEPYNIEVLYRWKGIETTQDFVMIPPQQNKAVEMANLIKYVCLESLDAVGDKNFVKKYFPKMLVFIGSGIFQFNGSEILGTAEGGLKITITRVNNLNVSNIDEINKRYIHTIFHEFSHILHQTIDYSNDYRKLTDKDYLGDTFHTSTDEEALQKGFISAYSRKDSNEDFVELIAYYVGSSDDAWAEKMNTAGASGREILNKKLSIIRDYLSFFWQVDLEVLRNEVQTRLANLPNVDLNKID